MKIEHVAMYVNDLEAARDFFVTHLRGKSNDGYHNPRTGFSSYFITFDDGARLELMKILGRPFIRCEKAADAGRSTYGTKAR